jgi:hypothetical protein
VCQVICRTRRGRLAANWLAASALPPIVQPEPAAADADHVHFSLRLLVIAVGLAGLAWLLATHLRGRPRPVPIALLALVLAYLGFAEYGAQAAEARYGRIASEIAHRGVRVRCEGLGHSLVNIGQEWGYVEFDADGDPSDTANLSRDACKGLARYAGGDRERLDDDLVVAVHTLAHEAIHLRGWTNEALTDCYGMQFTALVARRLGASARQAQRLAEYYWVRVYPEMPEGYRTAECVDGGRLDLHKDSPVWP